MKILFLSHTPMGGPFVVGSHHLARTLVRLGHQVAHLSPPVTPAHLMLMRSGFERERIRRWIRGGADFEGVRDLVPASPMPWALARTLGRPALRFGRAMRASAHHLLRRYGMGEPDLVLIDEPRLVHLLDHVGGARIVYRPTDLYASIRADDSITGAERQVCERADAFIATSQPVAEHLERLGANEVLVVENGVDVGHFERRQPQPDLGLPPAPRAIYAGALDRRFGFDALRAAARSNPEASFLLLGPPAQGGNAACVAEPNIHWLGGQAYQRLPGFMHCCQLALLPMSDDPANDGRSPMKIYEYAAAGLPVVATRSRELVRRALPFVRLAATPDEFAAAVTEALSAGNDAEAIRRIARGQSWETKSAQILEHAFGRVDEDAA